MEICLDPDCRGPCPFRACNPRPLLRPTSLPRFTIDMPSIKARRGERCQVRRPYPPKKARPPPPPPPRVPDSSKALVDDGSCRFCRSGFLCPRHTGAQIGRFLRGRSSVSPTSPAHPFSIPSFRCRTARYMPAISSLASRAGVSTAVQLVLHQQILLVPGQEVG